MTKKKTSAKKKLLPAIGMLAISGAMLASSTYAWFTMNKEVSVTGMEMKAHAEEGLLINEVKLAKSGTWDEQATANATPTEIQLRPASTQNFTKWWHANSKKSADEAGVGDDKSNTVVISGTGDNAVLYDEVTAGTSSDYVLVADADAATAGTEGKATGNSKAETHVYYKQASFGDAEKAAYDPGEGFYVKYTYYLKSSSSDELSVKNLQAKVTATKKNVAGATDSTDLDKALRVGIEYKTAKYIFAPVSGADASYKVTTDNKGTAGDVVNYTTSTDYVQINKTGDTVTNVTVPSVTTDGAPVYVYVWFEGEDTNCMSDNLTATLDTYDIDISFKDADLD